MKNTRNKQYQKKTRRIIRCAQVHVITEICQINLSMHWLKLYKISTNENHFCCLILYGSCPSGKIIEFLILIDQ